MVYLPFREAPPRTASLLVRSALPPASVMTAVREAVQTLDADQPVFAIETVANVFAGERSIYRIFATLFGLLATIGIVLSAVGVYGVMAYAVAQRTQEIGVRMAIGAGRWDVAWLFLRRGLAQLAIAVVIGVPAALALGTLARFQLVEIEPSDPVTFDQHPRAAGRGRTHRVPGSCSQGRARRSRDCAAIRMKGGLRKSHPPLFLIFNF